MCLYIYFWLGWVFVTAQAFLQLQHTGTLSSCARTSPRSRFSLPPPSSGTRARELRLNALLTGLQSLQLLCAGACCSAHGIFPGQGMNSCLLHWRANSLPLSHRGSPMSPIFLRDLFEWVLVVHVFPEICLFHHSCLIYWNIIILNSPLLSL